MAVESRETVRTSYPVARLTPVQAVQRHLPLVLGPVAACVALALLIGVARTPTYSSLAEINVGGVNLTVQSIPGYSVAVAQLADVYARSIDAGAVVDNGARIAGIPPQQFVDDVSATPVQGVPVIRIDAKGSSAVEAQRLADAAGNALAAYAGHLNRANPDTPRLLRRYVADSNALRSARASLASAGAAQRSSAQTRVDVLQLQQQTDGALYQQSQIGGSTTSFVQKLAPATAATSDRSTVLQQLVAGGLIAGLLIGVGLAVARANRDSRRRIQYEGVLRERVARTPLIAWVLLGSGALYFAAATSSSHSTARKVALAAVAAAIVIELVRRAEPAWLVSAGIASSMFAGNWNQFGLGSTIVPERVLIAAGLLAALLRIGPSRNRRRIELGGVHLALAIAFTYAVLSAIASNTILYHPAWFALFDQFGAIPFVAFALGPVIFRTGYQRRILLGSLVATGAYLSVTALLEKLHVWALVLPSYIGDPAVGIHWGRARGPFVEAVANGLAIYACGVAAVVAVAVWRSRPWRILAGGVALLSAVGLILTETRAVWLGGAIATVLVLAATPRLRRYLVPTIALGVCVVLVSFAAIPGLATESANRQNDKAPIYDRQNSDMAALRMVAAKPLIGFGWFRHNATAEPYFRLNPAIPFSGEIAGAGLHNLFLTYAVDLGLVGFGLWLLAAGLAFGSAARLRGPPELEPWRIALGALVACYITAGIAGPLAYPYPTLLLWTWAGVAYRPRVGTALSAAGRRDHLQQLPGEAA